MRGRSILIGRTTIMTYSAIPNRIFRTIGVSAAFVAFLFVCVHLPALAGVRTTPQIVFADYHQRSVHVNVNNPSDNPIEVWIEFKYGYHISDDTGKITVITPDTLQADDKSAASWIKAYPQRFTLGPAESQVVRFVVNAPSGLSAGEYWARILIASKDQKKPQIAGKKGFGAAFELVTITSVPFHYRYLDVSTGLELVRALEYRSSGNILSAILPVKRTGNASYWGMVNCRIIRDGKTLVSHDYNLVVYKDLTYKMDIDRTNVPSGEYTLEVDVRTQRADIDNRNVIKAEPLSWSIP